MSKLIYSIEEAAALVCLSRTELHRRIQAGALRVVYLGDRKIGITPEDLKTFVDALPRSPTANNGTGANGRANSSVGRTGKSSGTNRPSSGDDGLKTERPLRVIGTK